LKVITEITHLLTRMTALGLLYHSITTDPNVCRKNVWDTRAANQW